MNLRVSIVLLLILFLLLVGCAEVGPGPTIPNYQKAIKTLPVAKNAIYTLGAHWYPNTLLGDADSFHHPATSGRLFVTPERLIFAVYDDTTNNFLQAYEVLFSHITWMTGKIFGRARIIRFQADNSIQSFLLWSETENEGQTLDKDEIFEFKISFKSPPSK